MKKLIPLLLLTAAGLLAVPAVVQAEDPKPAGPGGEKHGPGHMNPEERLKMMTEKLGLSQDQQDKIKAIFAQNAPAMKELMAKGRDNLTEEDKTKLREMMKTQMEEIGAVLTPDQKEKWKEARAAGGPGGHRGKPGEKPPEAK